MTHRQKLTFTKIICFTIIFTVVGFSAYSQKSEQDSTSRKFFAGSSFFVLGNFIPDDPNPPDFIQLNFGYRITPKDVVSIDGYPDQSEKSNQNEVGSNYIAYTLISKKNGQN